MTPEKFLLDLAVILIAAKLGGELAERFKQPAVLGELFAGILVGMSVLGACGAIPGIGPALFGLAIQPENEILHIIAEVGAVLLLFEAGLESDLEELKSLGLVALWVAVVGVVLPFIFGYFVAHLMGLPFPTAIFMGAAMTATSVGVTARTFADLKVNHQPEAKVVLGAAVADDVLGLIILAVVSGMAVTAPIAAGTAHVVAEVAPKSPVVVTLIALTFLVGSLFLGIFAAPHILRYVSKMRTRAALATSAVIFCFLMSAFAFKVGGLAPIVGAFAAGLILSTTEHKLHFEERIKPIADIFIPVFFVVTGARMPLNQIDPTTAAGRHVLLVGLGLIVVAIIGKVLAGLTVPTKGLSRWTIGIGMIPRGEVGLIFASVGKQKGLIDDGMFVSIVLMVMVTTFVTPPLLKIVLSKDRDKRQPEKTELEHTETLGTVAPEAG